MRGADAAAADVQRRRDDAIGAERLEREHGADDVDDRVERADLVQVDLVERRAVDGRLGLAEPREQRLRAVLASPAQRRAVDQAIDLRERAMAMRVMTYVFVRLCVRLMMVRVVVGPLMVVRVVSRQILAADAELRRR